MSNDYSNSLYGVPCTIITSIRFPISGLLVKRVMQFKVCQARSIEFSFLFVLSQIFIIIFIAILITILSLFISVSSQLLLQLFYFYYRFYCFCLGFYRRFDRFYRGFISIFSVIFIELIELFTRNKCLHRTHPLFRRTSPYAIITSALSRTRKQTNDKQVTMQLLSIKKRKNDCWWGG